MEQVDEVEDVEERAIAELEVPIKIVSEEKPKDGREEVKEE